MNEVRSQKNSIRRQHGFALVAVLWLMAGLTIVVALVADVAHAAAERDALLRKRNDFLLNSLSAKAHIQYAIAVSQTGVAQFYFNQKELRADGTLYRFNNNEFISLQDHGGLVSLSPINRGQLENFLDLCGVEKEKISHLIDALEDYIDEDNLQRINGAEIIDYSEAGLPGPRNAPLLTKDEIWAVYGWKEYRSKFIENGCIDEMTIYGETTMLGTSLNLATSPVRVLKAMGLGLDYMDDLEKARGDENKMLEQIQHKNQILAANRGGFGMLSGKHVQRTLTVTHFSEKAPWKWRYILKLDSNNDNAPWVVINSELLPASENDDFIHSIIWPLEKYENTEINANKFDIFQ